MTEAERLPSSFRDPSGFVFRSNGVLRRQVNRSYQADWEAIAQSGLLEKLVTEGQMVQFQHIELSAALTDDAIAVLEPQPIPFISYPYEWCFSQLKDAALLTLSIQKAAIEHGLSLKDASAYNVQFLKGKPVFIDTLSFERYREGEPWVAYRQFCGHFLAPLALMALVDIRLGVLQRSYIDGIPLDLASELLPGMSKFKPGLAAHIHVHARAQRADGKESGSTRQANISKTGMLALIDSLEGTVKSLHYEPKATEWAEYYSETNYSAVAMEAKHRLVDGFIGEVNSSRPTCWDLGSNTGEFSRIAAKRGYLTLAIDGDPAAVEKAYAVGQPDILPLLIDLANPSPGLGWSSGERDSLVDRGPAGLVLALALVHHLAIGNNVPLSMLADFFSRIGEWLVVEFVPKSDSQVARLLRSREDIFVDYTPAGFEAAMARRFSLVRSEVIEGSERTLYLFKKLL